jgi:hypothetical protein
MRIVVRELLHDYNRRSVRRNSNFFREEIETHIKEKKSPKGKLPPDSKS